MWFSIAVNLSMQIKTEQNGCFYFERKSAIATLIHKGGSCGTSCLCMTLTDPVIYPGWHFLVVFITFTGCTRFLFYQQNAVRVWAVSRSYDRREPSVFHHSWDWTEPPGRHWDRKENDKNGKGNVKKQTRIGLSFRYIYAQTIKHTHAHDIPSVSWTSFIRKQYDTFLCFTQANHKLFVSDMKSWKQSWMLHLTSLCHLNGVSGISCKILNY